MSSLRAVPAVVAVLLAAILVAAPGASAAPKSPKITKVQCLRACVGAKSVAPGGLLKLRGERFSRGMRAAFKVRRVDRDGHRSAAVVVTDLGERRNSGYPRMARMGRELVFAWTGAGDLPRVQTAVARLP